MPPRLILREVFHAALQRHLMKTASPLGQGGTSGGFLNEGINPAGARDAVAVVRSGADEPAHQPPSRGRWPGIPSSTEEGSLFSRKLSMNLKEIAERCRKLANPYRIDDRENFQA